jgi:hypothetical protein
MPTGFTHYKGFRAAQHGDFPTVFGPFLEEQKFDIIIEIGTLNGGLTRYLRDASPNSRIISYDICNQPEHTQLIECGIEVKIVNIFGDKEVTNQEALDILQLSGKKLFLCDGGNKPNEFNILSQYVRSGDFIMGHDYAKSSKYFREHINGKVWNWLELEDTQIAVACSMYNLVDYKSDLFQSIVWVCKTKN